MKSDEYYFPPGRSMARRVHGERSVGLLYGQRGLLIGALEPLTYTGTMLTTKSRDRPPRRQRLLGLRPGADAVDAGGDRRTGAGDVRDDGAAAERSRARVALA